MKVLTLSRTALGVGATAALLTGCGALSPSLSKGPDDMQPPVSVPGTALKPHVAINSMSGAYKVLYSFQGGSDGELPIGEEAPLAVSRGALYGTTQAGGGTGCTAGHGCGTVFSTTPQGAEKVIYAFKGQADVGNPTGPLISFKGAWYGVAATDGSQYQGGVFAVSKSGHEHLVYSFKGQKDGSHPYGWLIAYNGLLYGTTVSGGQNYGTVFSVSASGNEQVLHSFGAHDGETPYAGLALLNGTLYGTTIYGGTKKSGTVFAISPSGKEHVVYNFQGGSDGANPQAPLVAIGGELYGTTTAGGGQGYEGIAFKVTTSGKEQVLHRFQMSTSDGYESQSTLLDFGGTLYGTTFAGGTYSEGVVFSLTMSGTERVLHNFQGVSDGMYPTGGLMLLGKTLYGTTTMGGKGPCYSGAGCGTIFALTP